MGEFEEFNPRKLADLYKNANYKVTYKKVDVTGFLNNLHTIQLDMIDEVVDKSDLKEAKEVIEWIKSK